MGEVFTTLDLVVFVVALVGVMAVGLVAGRKEDTSEDYFLAGRGIPWWGVAGSIFGSNVSANHMVGMMGVGFTIGFAQSHFELGAVLGLMVLCYGFLPVYRKLGLYTLSEYLGRRYDARSRVAYAVILIVIMAVVQLVPGLYIGARATCVLLGGDAVREVSLAGGAVEQQVSFAWYAAFVVALGAVAAGYTIFGGLKAVIWTDVIQSMLLLAAGIVIAILTFRELGGWGAMMALDRAGADRMHLYLPASHPQLPWTGVLTGLMLMHTFYWGTNQFIVQRALGARSDAEARLGIVAAGFLKLAIPFFAIGTGVAAYYLFQQRLPERAVDSDAAFPELVRLVVPLGWGLVGVISAGLIGAILSSIDSMMNSAATLVSVDLYREYVNPDASDRQMIRVGRLSIAVFVTLAAALAITVMDPNSDEHFFLQIASYQSYLTPGLLVAFLLGMFWQRGTAGAAFATIGAGVVFSALVQLGYDHGLGRLPALAAVLGRELNFFHRVVVVVALCTLLYVGVSLRGRVEPERARLTWTDLGGHDPGDLRRALGTIALALACFAALALAVARGGLAPGTAAVLGAAVAGLGVWLPILRHRRDVLADAQASDPSPAWRDDRLWAGVLCAGGVFLHFWFW